MFLLRGCFDGVLGWYLTNLFVCGLAFYDWYCLLDLRILRLAYCGLGIGLTRCSCVDLVGFGFIVWLY